MFRMKHYNIESNQLLHTAGAPLAAPQRWSSAPASNAPDYAWEFGWSFTGGDWLRRSEPEPMQASSLDKALALSG